VSVALGGNIGADFGPPASTIALAEPAPEWIVLELSSFQLADIQDLTPDVAVLTNLGDDHLDRYDSVEAYHADKRRLVEAGTEDTVWVVNQDDAAVEAMTAEARGTKYGFSLEHPVCPGAFLSGDALTVDLGGGPYVAARVSDLRLVGRHNVANALAALLAACGTGTPLDLMRPGLTTFDPLPHRLEPIETSDGVRWINDSKATNVAATRGAIRSLEGSIVLLLGGKDKGESFRVLVPDLVGPVRLVVAYGEAGERIEDEIESDVDVRRVQGTFDEAVSLAKSLARRGETLLLSPACSSYDQFSDYRARGDRFRALARRAIG